MFLALKERYKGLKEWGVIEKSFSHKYIKRYPKKTGKGYNYIYADSWKKPFSALLSCFGIGRKKIDADYESGSIKKEFGADKKTFAAHALEYFTNKVKWDALFAKKEAREKYKKPVTQKELTMRIAAEKVVRPLEPKTAGTQQQNEAMPINRSLMRKVWSMYSAEGKRIEAQENAAKQKEAAKDGVFTDKAENAAAKIDLETLKRAAYEYGRQHSALKVLSDKAYVDLGIAHFKVGEGAAEVLQAFRDGQFDKNDEDAKAALKDTHQAQDMYSVSDKPAAKEEKISEAEAHANRSNAMKGNQNAKKDGILSEEADDGGKENNAQLEFTGFSDGAQNVRIRGRKGTGGANAAGRKVGDNGAQSVFSPNQSGTGLTDADGNVDRGRGRIGKAQARKIREQCREILKKPDDKITEADKQILAQYVGAGGTGEDGASNSGVLYEFYTPRSVVSKVWQLVDKYNPRQDKSVIEPSGGIGRFAEGLSEKITLFELEQESARIAHILHPDAEVVQGAFQEHFLKNKNGRFTKDFKKFDVAVGNPPYGAYTGKYKGLGEGKDFKRYDSYFMARTLDTLADGGIMAMVVPSGFLDGKSTYGKDLEKIAGKAKLLEAWRLPNGTFDSTDVGTDIVVFKKGDGGSVEELKIYFKNNPEHIAGVVSTRTGRFGKEETYVKPKEGESFESAIANIDVGKTETENAVKAAAETVGVKSETKEASPVTAKTMFGDTVKTKSGTGVVRGYVKKNGKTAGVIVNVDGKSEEVLFTDEQTQKRSRSDAMKGNQNAKGEHDYPQNPAAHIIGVEEFNKKYGKKVDAQDMPIWKATDKFGNVDMTKLTAEQQRYVETSPHFVKDGGVYVNVVNYASGNIRQKLRALDENDAQYALKKSLLESVCPKTKKIGEFTLSPITDWAREYVMQDGGNLIDGFFTWAYNGNGYFSAGDSPISTEEIPAEISFYDIEAFIEKIPLKLAKNEADTDDPKLKERYKERKKQLRRDTAIKLFNRYLAEGLSIEEHAGVIAGFESHNKYTPASRFRLAAKLAKNGVLRCCKRKIVLPKRRNEFCLQNSGGLQTP
ncbi:MAG: Eco57I restriction-modification methylase domain-containing protein [Treponema sp.]